MKFSYVNPEQTSIQMLNEETGAVTQFDLESSWYRWLEQEEMLNQIEAYVAPPEPEPLTTEEKVNKLLSDYGLTRTELLEVLS